MATAGELESKRKKKLGKGQRENCDDFCPPAPTCSLDRPASVFSSRSPAPERRTRSLSPIRHPKAGATYATWSNLVPGGRERELSTCTCGCSGRLLSSFFFFFPFPPPRSSGFQNHLENNQQVGRCLLPRWTDAVGRFNAS